jgi:hypothetical protein
MHRPFIHRLVVGGVLALGVIATAAAPAAASSVAGMASNRPGDPASASSPGTLTEDVSVLSVRGAGPYRIGARLHDLQAAGLIDWIAQQPGCDVVSTGVTGEWSGVLILVFQSGRLVEVGTATTPPRSPAGASVGTPWSELEDIYGNRGRMVYNSDGDQAYAVRIGSRVELFTGHPIRDGVGYFQAGSADFILSNFLHRPVC